MEINKFDILIFQLSKGDLSIYEYINIKDEILKDGFTDHKIIDTIWNANRKEEYVVDETEFTLILKRVSPTEVEKTIDKIIRFLYEQEPEFGEVNEELKVLKKLYKKVRILIVKNFKQVNLYYFQCDNIV